MPPLWIAIRLPRLPLEALAPSSSEYCAVFERTGNRRLITCCNEAAAASGISSGMALGAATALAPALKARERRISAERHALGSICALAYQVSAMITAQDTAPEFRGHTVWLEVASSLRLFHGLDAIIGKLESGLARLGYSHQLGIAPTQEGAALLAEARQVPALDRTQLLAAMKPLPLTLLHLQAATLKALRACGMRRIGEVLAIPTNEFAMRFGQDAMDYLRRLAGWQPDVRRYYRPAERYRRYFEFEGELESTEALLFPLKRLLVELQEYLIARDAAIREFKLEFEHSDAPASVLDIGMSSPSRDAAHLLLLVRERLERVPMPGPVQAITVRADRFALPRIGQKELFVIQSAEDEEWTAVLDRMRARLGSEAIRSLGLADDYRPEKSWLPVPAGSERAAPIQKCRPLWLLPSPRLLASRPLCVSEPERSEGGWWDGFDASRDYYTAQTQDGARLWVYQDRSSGGWYLQGLWS